MGLGLEVFSWRDFIGQKGYTRIWVLADTNAIAIQDVLQSVSNAHWSASRGPEIVQDDQMFGTADVYQDIADKIRWHFHAEDSTLHFYETPAPIASLLLADGVSVDSTNATVIAFKDAILANGVTPSGAALDTFLGALRTRRRRRRAPIVVTPP